METAKQKHIESITVDALMQFRGEAKMAMASYHGHNGRAQIGVTGMGQFFVDAKGETYLFDNPDIAVDAYLTEISTTNETHP